MAEIHDKNQGALLGDLPSDNLESTLDNYDPSRNTFPEEGVYAQNLARALVEVPQGTPAGLLLTGEPGNGKTHLAIGIGRAVAEQGGKAAFTKFAGSQWSLSSVPGGDPGVGWYSQLDKFVTAHDVLIFDDLPGDMAPGWRKVLQNIIVASYDQGKSVVMTSNHPAPEVIEQLARRSSGDTGASDVGPAVRERIRQAWNLVEFRGESFRSRQQKWYSDIARPEDSPTIDQAVRVAAELDKQHREQTLLQAIGVALVPLLTSAGIPLPQLQRLKEELGIDKK